jgi:lysophospholipase L1-like esterase
MKKLILLTFILVIGLFITTAPVKAQNYNVYDGKTIAFIGDSITYGVGASDVSNQFSHIVSENLGFDSYNNLGVSGAFVAEEGDAYEIADFTADVPAGTDVIVIYGGINDYFQGTALQGVVGDTTDATWYGALNLMFDEVTTAYPDAQIVVVTPHKSHYLGHASSVANATSGLTLAQYNDIMIARARAFDIDVLDFYNISGFDAATDLDDRALYTTDGLHLSDAGNKRLADLLVHFLLQENDPDDLFVASSATEDNIVSAADGTFSALNNYSHSAYIPVFPGNSYVYYDWDKTDVPQPQSLAWFDLSKAFISGVTGTQKNEIVTAPAGAAYAVFNYDNSLLANVYFTQLFDYELPEFASSPSVVTISDTTAFDISYIEDLLVVTDNTDDENQLEITLVSDTFTDHVVEHGTWNVVYQVEDRFGNTAQKEVDITVVDYSIPFIAIDDEYISFSTSNPIVSSQIIGNLYLFGIANSSLDYTTGVTKNTVLGHETQVGVYDLNLTLTYSDASTQAITLEVETVSGELTGGTVSSGGASTTITTPTDTLEFLGLAWYWWIGIAAGAYLLLGDKKRRRAIGKKIGLK